MSLPVSDSLTVREAAEYLRLSLASVYKMKALGLLPFYPAAVSKGFRIKLADLEAYIESRKRGRGAQPRDSRSAPPSVPR